MQGEVKYCLLVSKKEMANIKAGVQRAIITIDDFIFDEIENVDIQCRETSEKIQRRLLYIGFAKPHELFSASLIKRIDPIEFGTTKLRLMRLCSKAGDKRVALWYLGGDVESDKN